MGDESSSSDDEHQEERRQEEEPLVEVEKQPVEEGDENKKKKRKRKRKRKVATEVGDDDGEDNSTNKKDDDEGEKKKVDELDRTVHVTGFPFSATVEDVRKFFGDEGIVECRLPVWQDSGRLRGYGHIVFDNAQLYEAALAKSGQYLQKRYLVVSPAKRPKEVQSTPVTSLPSKTVALHNLSYTAMEEDIEGVMEKFGLIVDGGVRVVRHSSTGQSKGFGYVQYEEIESAQAAVKAAPVQIAGRACRLDYDHGRVKGSFRTRDRTLWQKEYGKSTTSSSRQKTNSN